MHDLRRWRPSATPLMIVCIGMRQFGSLGLCNGTIVWCCAMLITVPCMLQLSCGNTDFVPYVMDAEGRCIIDVPGALMASDGLVDKTIPLFNKLKRILKEVEMSNRLVPEGTKLNAFPKVSWGH